jgi:hypothetical protein
MKINKESGQVARLLLVLAVIVFVAVIVVYLVINMAEKPAQPVAPPGPAGPVLPVYEKQLGNIDFTFESALDRGQLLPASEIINTQFDSSNQKDLQIGNLGAKFIQVTVGAQNKGTQNTAVNAWTIENIVDSAGRNFVPLDNSSVSPWITKPNLCGALLTPAFDPSPCTKIYEVSKESTGLKIRIETGQNNSSLSASSGKADSFLLDLIVK